MFLTNMRCKDLKVMFLPTKIYTVDNRLTRGNAIFSPSKTLRLKHRNVTQVIDLRNNNKKSTKVLKKLEQFYCKLFGIKYENIPLPVTTTSVPEKDVFDKINSKIMHNSGKTYLHCHYGTHRTCLGVAMYEKNTGKNEGKIIADFVKNFWQNTSFDTSDFMKNKSIFVIFLKKYFPKFIH